MELSKGRIRREARRDEAATRAMARQMVRDLARQGFRFLGDAK